MPDKIIKDILLDEETYNRYCNFEHNRDFFEGYTLKELQNGLFDYIVDDIMVHAKFGIELPNQIYIETMKKISKPFDDPFAITNNIVFKIIRDINNNPQFHEFTYACDWEIAECEFIAEENKLDINKYLEIIRTKKSVSQKEFDIIAHLCSIGYDNFGGQETFEYIFKMIIDNDYVVDVCDYYGIFEKFTKLVAEKSDVFPIDVILTSDREELGSYEPFNIEMLGQKNSLDKAITLNTYELIPSNILDNINTVFHEVEHGIQITKPRFSNYDSLQLVKDLFLEEIYGKEFYVENYWNISYEAEARRKSAYRTMNFLQTFTESGAKKYKEYYQRELERSAEQKTREITKEDGKYYSDIDLLFQENVEAAVIDRKIWPIISQEYKEDGKRRLIVEFLTRRNPDNKEFYDSLIYNYDYSMEEIKDNALSLLFYKPADLKEKFEIGKKISVKLLKDLQTQLFIKGLTKVNYSKAKVEMIKNKLKLLAKNNGNNEIDNFEIEDSQLEIIESKKSEKGEKHGRKI